MTPIQKCRKLIILFKYSHQYARMLKRQNAAFDIKGHQKVNLDKEIRWNSIYEYFLRKNYFSNQKNPLL
jgi:hypothetical protein